VFTTSGQADGSTRWGTPRNVHINDVYAVQNGKVGSSLVSFDTHSEGWGITFSNCHVTVPDDDDASSNRGFQTRSRRTKFLGCSVAGSSVNNGFGIHGEGAVVKDCVVRDSWKGVIIEALTAGDIVDGCMVDGCIFQDMQGAGVQIEDGSDHWVSASQFRNCGTNTGDSRSAIYIASSGDGFKVNHCSMAKETNLFAVGGTSFGAGDVVLVGCNLRGYEADGSSEDTGFDVANAASATLHTETTGFNWHDT
jgi:hypothetical protein